MNLRIQRLCWIMLFRLLIIITRQNCLLAAMLHGSKVTAEEFGGSLDAAVDDATFITKLIHAEPVESPVTPVTSEKTI